MAGWFGHTQTLTSISKSVTTVASGILGLEDNLATFMKKVIYYDKFFQRVRANLPKEVTSTTERLFARCYEYRDEIRDELESSLAYVADAGRWVVGMEDWNSKMEKRLHQISELVLLANSLLVEYAMTGKLGGEGSKDELDAYLRNIASSVVLKNQTKKTNTKPSSPSVSRTNSRAKTIVVVSSNNANSSPNGSMSNSVESLKREMRLPPVSVDDTTTSGIHEPTTGAFEIEDRILDGPLTPLTSSTDESDPTGADSGGNFDDDNDDDSLNPFARDYQPPVDKYSLESSLASLANDSSSRNSSIPDLATYDADADNARSSHVPLDRLHSDDSFAGDGEDGDELDSSVNLCEYECLDMDSIPKYDAFKPSIRSRVQRMNAVHTSAASGTGMHTMSSSNHSLASYHSSMENGGGGYPASMQSSFASSTGDDRSQFADSTVATLASAATTTSSASKVTKRRPKRMMDMNYSYDFQREQDYNPFMSPPMTFRPDNTSVAPGEGIEGFSELDLSCSPKIDEEPLHLEVLEEVLEAQQQSEDGDQRETRIEEPLPPHVEVANTHLGVEEDQREARIDEPASSDLVMPERLSDYDETEALIAALAAASEDYNFFGEAHE